MGLFEKSPTPQKLCSMEKETAMTKTMRWMLMGIALLILGTWGAALNEYGNFYGLVAIFSPIAGIISIVISFLETE